MTVVLLRMTGRVAGLSMLIMAHAKAGPILPSGAHAGDNISTTLEIVQATKEKSSARKKTPAEPKPPAIVPEKASYVILRDINIRTRPETKSKRLGRFKKGALIQSIGRAKGTGWIRVRTVEGKAGFVYSKMAAPLIDGALKSKIEGRLTGPGATACSYTIEFEGKSQIEKELQRTADYAVPFECNLSGQPVKFTATMFLTELPYKETGPALYQINVDLRNMPLEGEDVLTVIMLYNPKKSEVRFDTVNDSAFAGTTKIVPKNAAGLGAALQAAVEIAHAAWGKAAWEQLTPKTEFPSKLK